MSVLEIKDLHMIYEWWFIKKTDQWYSGDSAADKSGYQFSILGIKHILTDQNAK